MPINCKLKLDEKYTALSASMPSGLNKQLKYSSLSPVYEFVSVATETVCAFLGNLAVDLCMIFCAVL